MFGLETLLAIIHHAEQLHMTSPLEDAFEDGFAQGLGAGLGLGNFKFLGIKLPCMSSLVKYEGPFIVASTRSPVERVKITGCPGSKIDDCMVSGRNKGKMIHISPKSELCGFKWANNHNKCVHDSM